MTPPLSVSDRWWIGAQCHRLVGDLLGFHTQRLIVHPRPGTNRVNERAFVLDHAAGEVRRRFGRPLARRYIEQCWAFYHRSKREFIQQDQHVKEFHQRAMFAAAARERRLAIRYERHLAKVDRYLAKMTKKYPNGFPPEAIQSISKVMSAP